MRVDIAWKLEPDDHDYPAARDYLDLVVPTHVAELIVAALRSAPMTTRKSKDLLRASGLTPLGDDNVHVAKDLHKIRTGAANAP